MAISCTSRIASIHKFLYLTLSYALSNHFVKPLSVLMLHERSSVAIDIVPLPEMIPTSIPPAIESNNVFPGYS